MVADDVETRTGGGMPIGAWEAFRVRTVALEQAVRMLGARRPALFAAEHEREVLRVAAVFAQFLTTGTTGDAHHE